MGQNKIKNQIGYLMKSLLNFPIIKISFLIIAGSALLPLKLSAKSPADDPVSITPIDFQGIGIGSNIPPDVSLTQENRQRDMDIFSWNSFVALNWPNKANVSDKPHLIGDTANGDHSTVWEDWMSTADIFDIPTGKEPKWGEHYVPRACSANSDYQPGMKILTQVNKSGDFFKEAFSGALVDQSGNFVRYEILINQNMFNTIKTNRLYDKAGQKKSSSISFTCGDNGSGDEGAIMIKAAWKIMNNTDDQSRYHTDKAMVFTPAQYRSDKKDFCEKQTIGLVGMHIVHKTVKQPQWIWSSFEHRDNVPACDNQNTFFTDPSDLNTPTCPSDSPHYYSFYGTSKTAVSACNTKPVPNAGTKFYLDKSGIKSQLCRENDLETSAPPVNKAYQNLLKAINKRSVWANYALIGTQWNSNIETSCESDANYVKKDVLPQYKIKNSTAGATPLPLANSTMESYEQGTSSCIECHSSASVAGKNGKTIDSDFVWFLNLEVEQ